MAGRFSSPFGPLVRGRLLSFNPVIPSTMIEGLRLAQGNPSMVTPAKDPWL